MILERQNTGIEDDQGFKALIIFVRWFVTSAKTQP